MLNKLPKLSKPGLIGFTLGIGLSLLAFSLFINLILAPRYVRVDQIEPFINELSAVSKALFTSGLVEYGEGNEIIINTVEVKGSVLAEE